jgi:hypothetical protein
MDFAAPVDKITYQYTGVGEAQVHRNVKGDSG